MNNYIYNIAQFNENYILYVFIRNSPRHPSAASDPLHVARI